MKTLVATLCLLWALPCLAGDDSTDQLGAIGKVIDEFHHAAAHGDAETYLGSMTRDAVFLGTDEWERWPKDPEFKAYVGSRFSDGKGWDYRPVERAIKIGPSGEVAWFDEVTYSDANGRFRGTGVVLREEGKWKIAHYAMSFLVLNENWEQVIKITQDTRALMKNSGRADENAGQDR